MSAKLGFDSKGWLLIARVRDGDKSAIPELLAHIATQLVSGEETPTDLQLFVSKAFKDASTAESPEKALVTALGFRRHGRSPKPIGEESMSELIDLALDLYHEGWSFGGKVKMSKASRLRKNDLARRIPLEAYALDRRLGAFVDGWAIHFKSIREDGNAPSAEDF
jgi:hypothetical protein